MNKLIFCNLDLLKTKLTNKDYPNFDFTSFDFNKLRKYRDKFLKYFKKIVDCTDNRVIFYSRNESYINKATNHFNDLGYTNFEYRLRENVESFINKYKKKNNHFVIIGGKNKDFELAVNSHSLYIVPDWLPLEYKTERYGIRVDTVKQLYKFILTLNNQNTWYSKLQVDDLTVCFSLMDARYGAYAKDYKEKDMIKNFQQLLKIGTNRNYYQILLYHFLAGMINTDFFDDIELYGMVPSSDYTLNLDIFEFMTQVRLLKKKRLPKNYMYASDCKPEKTNLLIWHTQKKKAHINRSVEDRVSLGAEDEFSTIHIHPDYRERIDLLKSGGRFNVCIFDDYMTYGNTFNAVRNLLEALGANKIVFVSMGLFRHPFQKKDYTIIGSVYDKDYAYILETSTILDNFKIDNDAKQEVSDLYDIFNS
ncbi:MAG: hypothetical protein HFG28_11885 [Eubacterium sp.]|nr:hypothetical protein [Eubacterium sp.]